ncbi:MAG: recombinase family protein [Mangrovicoccus sp.]
MIDALHPRALGYLRVSTADQRVDRQALGLRDYCDEMHVEYVSAAAKNRPVFDRVLARLRPGDTLLVWDLDRAFRSTLDAITTSEELRRRKIRLRIVRMNLDTSTAEGELFYTMMAAFAQFERRILSRRTREGIEAARSAGTILGRPCALDRDTVLDAHWYHTELRYPCRYLAFLLGVSRHTLARAFRREGLDYPLGGAPA